MAKTLNALGTYNDLVPQSEVWPGLDVLTRQGEGVVEDQHYVTAYRMRAHAGHAWVAGDVRAAGGGGTTVIKFFCYPRLHATTLSFVVLVDTAGAAVAGTPLSVAVFNDATGVPVAGSPWAPVGIAVGTPQQRWTGTVAGIAGDTLYRVEATLTGGAGGGDTIDLRSMAFRDQDLTAGELAAI